MMVGLDVVADVSGMWQESAANVGAGLGALVGTQTGDKVMMMADALDVLSGSMAVLAGLTSIVQSWNAVKSGLAAAETAVMAMTGPIGWSRIAIAAGAMATATAVVGGLTHYVLKANLENPSETMAVTQTIGAIA